MVVQITTASDFAEFIKKNKEGKVIVEFRAAWCQGSFVMRTPFQKYAVRYGQGNLKFGSVDIDIAGVDNLNSVRNDLNLGAIPAFYIYENNHLIEMLITCSAVRLDLFIKSHFFGYLASEESEEQPKSKEKTESKKSKSRSSSPRKRISGESPMARGRALNGSPSRKQQVSDDSPTIKRPQATTDPTKTTSQTDQRESRFPQIEKRLIANIKPNNFNKQITIDFFSQAPRSPSPEMKSKLRFKSPDDSIRSSPLNKRVTDGSPTRRLMQRSTNNIKDSEDNLKSSLKRTKTFNSKSLDLEKSVSNDLSNLKLNSNRVVSYDLNERPASADLVHKPKNKFREIK